MICVPMGIFEPWSTNCLKSCNSHGPDTLFISRRKKNQTSLIWTTGWRLRFLKMKSTGHLCSRSPAKKQKVNTRANPKKSQVVRSSLWIIFGQKKLLRLVQHRMCPVNWKWSMSVTFVMDQCTRFTNATSFSRCLSMTDRKPCSKLVDVFDV